MSAFEKRVRAWLSSERGKAGFEAMATVVERGAGESELVQRAAIAARAFELKGERERSRQAEQVGARRRAVASAAADLGAPVDEDGRVRRSHARRAIKRQATRGATGGHQMATGPLPPEPVESSSSPEQARRPSGLIVPGEGSLQEHIRAAAVEQEVRGDA